ncbi:MAG: hypothetical protein JNM68_15830, partial [Dinghuibacter sp.]|nr:hypothetical protein [Dinghuibacter sp.]
MSFRHINIFFLIVLSVLGTCRLYAQPPVTTLQVPTPQNADSASRVIRILDNGRIYVNAKDSIRYIVEHVVIRHDKTLFKADSVVHNEKLRFIEAFGRVYINDDDSVITTARYLKYFIDTRVAVLKNNVNIKSASGNFNSQEVEYDMNSKVATYKKSADIYTRKTHLTSQTGQYSTNSKDALFTGKVVLKDQDYNMYTDTLYYNSGTELATFVTYTKIFNKKKKQTIETTRGFYDTKRGIASFSEYSVIRDSSRIVAGQKIDYNEQQKTLQIERGYIYDTAKGQYISGNSIFIDDKNKFRRVIGNGVVKDSIEGIVITGNEIYSDENTGRSMATGKPVAIIKQENDSIFVAADTLFSGTIKAGEKIVTDTGKNVFRADTLNAVKNPPPDSAKRYLEAFHHVRIFSDSVQAVCDSLFYSGVDSVFRLYYEPIVWNNENQVTGDTIYLFTKNKKADRAEVFENGFMVNRVQKKFYNQIRGNRMIAYFTNGEIDSLFSKGSGEIIFYIQDKDSAFVGVDKSEADVIIAFFDKKEIYKLKWLNRYSAETIPMRDV